MLDVFVSYAHEDAQRVEPLVALLEANGRSAWWDRDIAPGTDFEERIEAALAEASCVVIALTEHASHSDWVRAEAAFGQQHNKLIPVLLDDVLIPLSLRTLQVADLRDWPNGCEAEVQKLLSAVTAYSSFGPQLFVGRDNAMHSLQNVLDAAVDGSGGLVLLSGEPGIGKSRCAEEFAGAAEDQGALVLWGRCHEQPGAPPYWPWVQILREYADANSDNELRVVLGDDSEVVMALIPEVGRRLALPEPGIDPAHGDQRFRLYDTISRIFTRAAANVPIVLIVDDLHWADPSSLALLEYLSKEIRRQRYVIVCAYRDVEVTRKSPLLATLGELSRAGRVERLRLSGLTVEDTGLLTAAISGMRIPQAVIEAIHQQTDGNPLFVREVARVLADQSLQGFGSTIAVDVPDGIREAIGRRLDRLSKTCNRLLTIASVLGREFDLEIVVQIAQIAVEDCIGELDAAVRAGMVQQHGSATSYRFKHAVIRETLYEEIPTLERLQLHRRVAEAMLAAFGENLDPVLSQLAHHFGEASALGDYEVAVKFALRAAEHDEQVYAYEEACRHYDSAVRILLANGCDHDRRAVEAYRRKGKLTFKISQFADGLETLTAGIGLARRLGDPDLFSEFVVMLIRITSAAPQRHSVTLVREALDLLPAGASPRRAILLAQLAFALRSTGDIRAVEQTAAEAISMARETADAAVLSYVLRFAIEGLRGEAHTLARRLEYGREMVSIGDVWNDPEEIAECSNWHLLNLIEAGEIASFSKLLDQYIEQAHAHNLPRHQYQAWSFQAMLNLLCGEWSEAERHIEQALARGQNIGDTTDGAEGVYGMQMFMLNRELGRLRAMAPLVQRTIEQGAVRMWAPGLMLMCCDVGLVDQARRTLDTLARDNFSSIPRDDLWLTSMVFCAQACADLGEIASAKSLYEQLLPFAAQTASTAAVCLGSVATYLGMLAQMMDRRDLAGRHFEQALEKNRAMGAWPALARTEMHFAKLLLTSEMEPDREAGRRLIAEAEQLASRFKLAGLIAEIAEILNDDASQLPDGLTPREVDVLKLLAIGRSNKDISKVLSISLSTVATHVRSILTKTGCANRTEAAAYAMRQQLI